ncbi:hypothetical protein KVR01_005460 [Diaporthe batatas]|uniref:uncharacterized protein n=1 Tax=Diaporthe batatas TaxID=748121 RepID=UPI001D0392B0|nr:uncharacterized protein KVR01_005460 [Diaporthe batatas]KAG8165185.1 hypothetical protein KVR01_005460 [Diaporthe batatas]
MHRSDRYICTLVGALCLAGASVYYTTRRKPHDHGRDDAHARFVVHVATSAILYATSLVSLSLTAAEHARLQAKLAGARRRNQKGLRPFQFWPLELAIWSTRVTGLLAALFTFAVPLVCPSEVPTVDVALRIPTFFYSARLLDLAVARARKPPIPRGAEAEPCYGLAKVMAGLLGLQLGLEGLHALLHHRCPNRLFDRPFSSAGFVEFWTCRWHQGAQSFLYHLGYVPARSVASRLFGPGAGRAAGVLGAFGLSGLWHAWSGWALTRAEYAWQVSGASRPGPTPGRRTSGRSAGLAGQFQAVTVPDLGRAVAPRQLPALHEPSCTGQSLSRKAAVLLRLPAVQYPCEIVCRSSNNK